MNQETIPRLGEAAMEVVARSYAHTADPIHFSFGNLEADRYFDYALILPSAIRLYRPLHREPLYRPPPPLPLLLATSKQKPRLTVKAHKRAQEAAHKARQRAQKQARKKGRQARKR